MSGDAEVALTSVLPVATAPPLVAGAVSRFHRVWPVAALALAVIINMAWIGFLGFEFFKLIEPAFL
jgi:hypothetical protein